MTTVLSVHSFRGGTGKSNTTSNLAAQLALRGRRVGVVDLDIQSPGIHVLFGFGDELTDTLDDVLWGRIPIASAARDVTDLVASQADRSVPGAVFLVPSSMNAKDIARILREGYDVSSLNDAFEELSKALSLDVLLLDTHPGLNEETLLSLSVSDALLLLLRPDNQDFQGTAVTVDIARRLQVPELLLVLNKVPSGIDLDDLRTQMTASYDAETAAILPLAEDVVRNASSQLFSLTHPSHPWSVGVGGLADRVMELG